MKTEIDGERDFEASPLDEPCENSMGCRPPKLVGLLAVILRCQVAEDSAARIDSNHGY